jgi:hypothetical protein
MRKHHALTEPTELVERALHDLEPELYALGKEARHAIYAALLDNLCQMLLIDGGPTTGLAVLEKGCDQLRTFEDYRGKKKAGPFLSRAQRQTLLESPGRYLRQDIEFTGPSGWTVFDGYGGFM